jgi:hypothetical protein
MQLSVPAVAALIALTSTWTPASAGGPGSRGAAPVEVALIADTPYGDAQRRQFPALVRDINADPQVRMVLHAGDVKNGSSTCDDARFADLAALYGTFADPFVLTPGDNEWTDCTGPRLAATCRPSGWRPSAASSTPSPGGPSAAGPHRS